MKHVNKQKYTEFIKHQKGRISWILILVRENEENLSFKLSKNYCVMQFLKSMLWEICAVQIFACIWGTAYFIWSGVRVMGKVKKYKREWLD
jgi:hypothetical protein